METVTSVETLEDYRLKVVFSTGDIKLFDVKPYLDRGIFSRLRDAALFGQAYVAYNSVSGEISRLPGQQTVLYAT